MTDTIETVDAAGSPFVVYSNYSVTLGDTFSGTVGPGDTDDRVNAQDMTSGAFYEFSMTLSSLAGSNEFAIYDPINYHAFRVSVIDGVIDNVTPTSVSFGEVYSVTLDGDTLSFTFSPNKTQAFVLQMQHGGDGLSYTVAMAEGLPFGVTTGSDNVTGTTFADMVDLLAGNDTFNAGGGNDTVLGNKGHDSINGQAGDDLINSGSQRDTLDGGDGADTLIGGGGNDSLRGGIGDDVLNGGSHNDDLDGGADNDRLLGGRGDDTLLGGDGNDTLNGMQDNDTMEGGAGDDLIIAGFGDDLMTGGAGADTFRLGSNFGNDTITDFTVGTDKIDLGSLDIGDFAALSIAQVGADAVLTFGEGTLTLEGVDALTLTASEFGLGTETIAGTSGDDSLYSNSGGDFIDAGAGDDMASGGAGSDTILGGDGKDRLYGDGGDDSIDGGLSDDRIYGGGGNDTLDGGARNDRIYGGSGDDQIDGGTHNDYLYGDGGADTITGGAGHDKLWGGADADTFVFGMEVGRDAINDFENGLDLIDMTGRTDFSGFVDLAVAMDGADAVITLAAGTEIRLVGIDVADVDAADFLF